MAKDYNLPHQNMIDLIPQNLRNPMVTSLVDNLFNRFLTKDEAVPLYGYVGRKPTASDDQTPPVPESTVERDINGIIPVLSFKVGAETHSFTVQDLVRKAEVLGISKDQSSWLYSQGNNYAPPIDLDKFTNFFNYYWTGLALPNAPTLSWNPKLAPEYYTIARPELTDLDKLNVVASTTRSIVRTGTGYVNQTWTVNFTNATTFTVTAVGGGLPAGSSLQGPFTLPTVTTQASDVFTVNFMVVDLTVPLLSFKIVRDPVFDGDGVWIQNETFAGGDSFTIVAPFISSTYSVTPNLGSGVKGKITAVNSLDQYQMIDGVRLKEGDRVLDKNSGNESENGIYVVGPGAFTRAPDFDADTAAEGARVFDLNRKVTYVATPTWIWTAQPSSSISNTNDWQESNLWIHRDELQTSDLDLAKVIQATRPIIEFQAELFLNTRFDAGVPSDTGTAYEQRKTEFNQAPLFNMYRYDGTHAGKVSPIFYYAEDPTSDIDPALQRRLAQATNNSADFLFEHGLIEEPNTLLFYKKRAPDPIPGPATINESLSEYMSLGVTSTTTGTFTSTESLMEGTSVNDNVLVSTVRNVNATDSVTSTDLSASSAAAPARPYNLDWEVNGTTYNLDPDTIGTEDQHGAYNKQLGWPPYQETGAVVFGRLRNFDTTTLVPAGANVTFTATFAKTNPGDPGVPPATLVQSSTTNRLFIIDLRSGGGGGAHRYWRVKNFSGLGGELYLYELQLWLSSGARADTSTTTISADATTTANNYGASFSSLLDGNSVGGGIDIFPFPSSSQYIKWDFGAGVTKAVTGFKYSNNLAYKLTGLTLEYSDDDITWITANSVSGLPGSTAALSTFVSTGGTYSIYWKVPMTITTTVAIDGVNTGITGTISSVLDLSTPYDDANEIRGASRFTASSTYG